MNEHEKEYIKNIDQANFYFESLGLDIRVGIASNNGYKKFYVAFPITDEYLGYKNKWMKHER